MNKESSKGNNTVITSDQYISESGLQGGKAIGEHIVLASFIIGIPFLIIGLIALIAIFFDYDFPKNAATIIGSLLVTIIGFLLVLGGFTIYREKHNIKNYSHK